MSWEEIDKQLTEKCRILQWLINGSGIHCIPMSALPHLTKEWIVKRYNVELSYFES